MNVHSLNTEVYFCPSNKCAFFNDVFFRVVSITYWHITGNGILCGECQETWFANLIKGHRETHLPAMWIWSSYLLRRVEVRNWKAVSVVIVNCFCVRPVGPADAYYNKYIIGEGLGRHTHTLLNSKPNRSMKRGEVGLHQPAWRNLFEEEEKSVEQIWRKPIAIFLSIPLYVLYTNNNFCNQICELNIMYRDVYQLCGLSTLCYYGLCGDTVRTRNRQEDVDQDVDRRQTLHHAQIRRAKAKGSASQQQWTLQVRAQCHKEFVYIFARRTNARSATYL